MNQTVETVKQEAARLGISLSEVRRRRNEATPRKETLRLENGKTYRSKSGEIVKVRRLQGHEYQPHDKCVFEGDNFLRYTEFGLYHEINGPLAALNLVELVET